MKCLREDSLFQVRVLQFIGLRGSDDSATQDPFGARPVPNFRCVSITLEGPTLLSRTTFVPLHRFTRDCTGIALLGAVLLAGCIGTDLVGEVPEEGGESIEISTAVPAAEVGQQIQFQSFFYNSDGSVDGTVVVTWMSSNPAVATIDAMGRISALSPGQTTVTASARGQDSNEIILTVVSDIDQVAMVELEPDELVLSPAETTQLSISASNVLGEAVPARDVTYVSANPDIASVSADGLVTANLPGTTTITASIDGVSSTPISIRVLGVQLQGNFSARQGTVYIVQGTAVLEEDATGFVTLSFLDNFLSSSGPGLHVYLSKSDGISASSIDLGDLRSTTGSQKYSIGDGLDTSAYRYVVIHCVPFNVTFGSARLQ